MILCDSFSGERVGVRFFFSSAAFLVERTLRLRGSTAPVVGVARGARPFLGRVDAWRCFLPSRLRSSRCAMGLPCSFCSADELRRILFQSTGRAEKKICPAGGASGV